MRTWSANSIEPGMCRLGWSGSMLVTKANLIRFAGLGLTFPNFDSELTNE